MRQVEALGHWRSLPREDGQAEVQCTVFLLSAAVQTTFPLLNCRTPGCGECLASDGREYAILRQSAQHAFAYELLYDWADKTGAGGTPWFTFWRDVLQRCMCY